MAPHNRDTSHHHVTARTPPQTRDATATARTPRRDRHDGHSHDVSTTGTAVIAYSGRGCGCDRIQRNVPARSTRHATPQANKHSSEQTFDRTHVLMLHIQQPPPWGSLPPGSKSRGRCVSGLKAECDFRGYLEKLGHGATGWNGAVFAVLASGGASWCGIFSCCNRCCTLHIVYNVPWIDVDGGRAQLGSASISGCYHSLRVA